MEVVIGFGVDWFFLLWVFLEVFLYYGNFESLCKEWLFIFLWRDCCELFRENLGWFGEFCYDVSFKVLNLCIVLNYCGDWVVIFIYWLLCDVGCFFFFYRVRFLLFFEWKLWFVLFEFCNGIMMFVCCIFSLGFFIFCCFDSLL